MKLLKALLISVAILSLFSVLGAQAPAWLWAESAGSAETEESLGLTTDPAGNVYVTGWFCDSVAFGSTTLTSAVANDIFVAKLDPQGNWLWAKRAGGMLLDSAQAIAADNAGNVFITGDFMFDADFGATQLTSNQFYSDDFVAKLDSQGNWLWAVRAGGAEIDCGNAVSVDYEWNCCVTGYFSVATDFGPFYLTSEGSRDFFAAKISAEGTWLCASRAGGEGDDIGYGICNDNTGFCYLTGSFSETADFGAQSITSAGGLSDAFFAKMAPGGSWMWAKSAGGLNSAATGDTGYGISADGAGNCYATGSFSGSAWFGENELTGTGNAYNIFAAKLDPSGNWVWARTPTGTHDGMGYGISTDAYGNSHITGGFGGTAQFGDTSITHAGVTDVFVAYLNSGGNWLWATNAGGPSSEWAAAIDVDGDGNSLVTGNFTGSTVFGSHILTGNGEDDIFVAKLDSGPVANDDETMPGTAGSFLQGAYPNPFRKGEAVRIKSAIPAGETSSLEIFNLRGQLVAGYQLSSGAHETLLENGGLAPGIYFCRLRCGSVSQAQKLVLLP